MRDVSRSSRSVARVAMDAGGVRRALLARRKRRSVRRNRVVLAPRPWRLSAQPCGRCGNGDNQRRSPGRARISRKAVARGRPGCLGCTCQTRVRSSLPIAHGAAGAAGARPSLRPLQRGSKRDCITRAESSCGNESACFAQGSDETGSSPRPACGERHRPPLAAVP